MESRHIWCPQSPPDAFKSQGRISYGLIGRLPFGPRVLQCLNSAIIVMQSEQNQESSARNLVLCDAGARRLFLFLCSFLPSSMGRPCLWSLQSRVFTTVLLPVALRHSAFLPRLLPTSCHICRLQAVESRVTGVRHLPPPAPAPVPAQVHLCARHLEIHSSTCIVSTIMVLLLTSHAPSSVPDKVQTGPLFPALPFSYSLINPSTVLLPPR